MKKIINWAKEHVRSVVAIVVFSITIIVCGAVMISSYASYVSYENNYYVQQLNIKANAPASPSSVYIDDEFSILKDDNSCTVDITKSNYPNMFTVLAKDIECTPNSGTGSFLVKKSEDNYREQYIGGMESVGGTAKITLNAAGNTYTDIEFVLASSIADKVEGRYKDTKDFFDSVQIKINDTEIAGEVILTSKKAGINWHHLVLECVALKEGVNTIEIVGSKTDSANSTKKIFPFIRNVNTYSNATITLGK